MRSEAAPSVHVLISSCRWITEFACQDFSSADKQASLDQIVDFMNTTVTFLESTDYVERYSWFGAMTGMEGVNPLNALMDGNGAINALGAQYIGAGNFSSTDGSFVPSIISHASVSAQWSMRLLLAVAVSCTAISF